MVSTCYWIRSRKEKPREKLLTKFVFIKASSDTNAFGYSTRNARRAVGFANKPHQTIQNKLKQWKHNIYLPLTFRDTSWVPQIRKQKARTYAAASVKIIGR
jgi:hypothetical protein